MPVLGFLLGNWRLVLVAVAALAIGGYIWTAESAKKRLAASVALAEAQSVANAKQALRDLHNKERSDENYSRNIARLDADLKRLRNSSPRFVPSSGSSPGGSATACYDAEQLNSALSAYRAGVVGLLEEGAKAVEGLDEAKAWAQER